jgi:hypothetical protein
MLVLRDGVGMGRRGSGTDFREFREMGIDNRARRVYVHISPNVDGSNPESERTSKRRWVWVSARSVGVLLCVEIIRPRRGGFIAGPTSGYGFRARTNALTSFPPDAAKRA